ncbi:MAG: chromate efflux transporter [Dehalococcoidia bacterium]
MAESTETPAPGSAREVALLFLRLGCIAFGGPAAHVALMRREVVERLGWLPEQEFLDLFGAANLIPGPSSTELAIFLGYRRAGRIALVLAGVLFILPAMLLVFAFGWIYRRYGTTPGVAHLLYGVKPVIIAVVASALWGLSRTAVKGPLSVAAALALFLIGVNPLPLLLGGGVLLVLVRWLRQFRAGGHPAAAVLTPALVMRLGSLAAPLAAVTAAAYSPVTLFLTFLKIGAVLYGSGYVLLAFLRDDFVTRLHWLTNQQLIDAVAVGQFTPGPVFTTATFVGYLTGGWGGGLLATLAIFLPSFLYVPLVAPLVPAARRSPLVRSALDGVNVAALGLMAAVTWQLLRAAVIDVPTALLAFVALIAIIRFKLNSAWLVLAGGVAGIAIKQLTGG